MSKAYIYFNNKDNKEYNGEGLYVLMFEDKVIGSHFCSNRSFANHDLTIWRLEELNKYEIDEVISNNEIVWSRTNEQINKETDLEFKVANDIYEAKYCN